MLPGIELDDNPLVGTLLVGAKLAAGRAGYGLALQHQSQPKAMLLDFENILGNMAKVNPMIEVYERAE